jgi:LytR_cpsA_psr family
VPIIDDSYPAANGADRRIYIPSGLQHMDGTAALRYARSRHGKVGHSSDDFDRAARQQRLLISMREQADPQDLIPRLPDLIDALKKAVRTDIPVSQLAPLLGLASQIDTSNISSYVFKPPLYGNETAPGAPLYQMFPNVSRIRSAVNDAFDESAQDEATREKLAEEGATIYVDSGLDDRSVGPALAGYLEYRGMAASSPRAKPEGAIPAHTQIVVYNGADAEMADTIAYLEKTFKVKATIATDPVVRADIVVTIGRDTPSLEAPPLS